MDHKSVLYGMNDLPALRASSGPVDAVVPIEKKIDVAPEMTCKPPKDLHVTATLPKERSEY
jgi:hypothetical protein